jgi:hypothetical protein
LLLVLASEVILRSEIRETPQALGSLIFAYYGSQDYKITPRH